MLIWCICTIPPVVADLRCGPQPGGPGPHFVWPLPFDLFGMGGYVRNLRSRQHSSPRYWETQTSLHDMAVVLEEDYNYHIHY
jgi:hypothetical protein